MLSFAKRAHIGTLIIVIFRCGWPSYSLRLTYSLTDLLTRAAVMFAVSVCRLDNVVVIIECFRAVEMRKSTMNRSASRHICRSTVYSSVSRGTRCVLRAPSCGPNAQHPELITIRMTPFNGYCCFHQYVRSVCNQSAFFMTSINLGILYS